MNNQILLDTATTMMADGKGLLAMDESTATCNKRFAQAGIPETEAARRDWRELIVTTPELARYISSAILYDETIRQKKKDGGMIINSIIEAGIIPGIKVDTGAKQMVGHPGEKITEGLDGLRERLAEYAEMGARFAKWRAVIAIGKGIPSRLCIEANAAALAFYAKLCQEADLVPIVEPEVLMDGDHDLQRSFDVTNFVIKNVFDRLNEEDIFLQGMILKPAMVIAGVDSPYQATIDEVADATINCLMDAVPHAVGGIAFLSGGQSGKLASAHLNAIHTRFTSGLPWPVTFSFARAIQQPALDLWLGKAANVDAAQKVLLHRAKCDAAALSGMYDHKMELQSN